MVGYVGERARRRKRRHIFIIFLVIISLPIIYFSYNVEDDKYSPNTAVVEFPVHEPYFTQGKSEVSIWEQLEIAAQYQYYWADNSVSITVTFKPEEASQIKAALELYETRLKAVSFTQKHVQAS